MFFYEDLICPVCDKIFLPDDDVVSCPECGAPHHRACWQKTGACSLKEFHGTADQWSKEKALEQSKAYETLEDGFGTKICPNCKTENLEFSEFCYKCGRDLVHNEWNSVPFHRAHTIPNNDPNSQNQNNSHNSQAGGYESGCVEDADPNMQGGYCEYAPFTTTMFNSLGGIPKDEQLGGISAEEIATYVGTNSFYYAPRFLKLDREKSNVSWNWAAFLFTPYWLLYRKNKIAGFLVFIFDLASLLFTNFVSQTYIYPNIQNQTYEEIYNFILNNQSLNNFFLIISILYLTNFLIRIVFGFFGNSLYFSKVKSDINNIRAKHYGKNPIVNFIKPEYRNELLTAGGVGFSLVAVAIGIHFFVTYIFTIIIQNI